MKIIPIKYAESFLPEGMIFENGAKDISRPIDFIIYLIETEDRRILVDAGCDTMPDFDMKNFISPIAALKDLGISTDDITDLIITHAHHDHIECAKYFDRSTIHIQKHEYTKGARYLPADAHVNIFEEGYSVCDGVRVICIGGHTSGSCIVEVEAGKNLYVIVGDECYSYECLERRIPTGSSKHPQRSKEFIEKYSSEEYTPLLCHEEYKKKIICD